MATIVDTDHFDSNQGSNASNSDIPNSPRDSDGIGESIGEQTKRKPGRPKGSRNKIAIGERNRGDSDTDIGNENPATESIPGAEQETISVQGQKTRRGRPRKVTTKIIENPAEISRLVLGKFEELASVLLGDDGKFQPTERFFLEVGMQDTLTKMPTETAEKIIGIVSPISLIIGVALYGVRVGSIVMEKRNQNLKEQQEQFVAQKTQPIEINDIPTEFSMRNTIVPPRTDLGI